jgi:hypothetical protein
MVSHIFLALTLAALLPCTGMNPQPDGPDGKTQKRFFDKIRVLGVESGQGEVTVVDPEGKSRTWKKGDRITEENAVLDNVTRSLLVFTRNVEGPNGARGDSLIVVRFDASGKTKVREYSSVSDSPLPKAPPHDSNLLP